MEIINLNGIEIPTIGYGTWTLSGESASNLVASALESGYRHIDTAAMYKNEEHVGEGIRNSGINRSEIFLTTKVWSTEISEGALQKSVKVSLQKLQVDVVDLVLIHWPSKTIPLAETMSALSEVQKSGLAKNVGVSNFSVSLLQEAINLADVPIFCNQVEYHPYLDQGEILKYCTDNDVVFVSYCPLYRGGRLFEEKIIKSLSLKYEKTPAQIVLRWHIQHEGVSAIPRSQNPSRIKENLNIFDFKLDQIEMDKISELSVHNLRLCG